jgi:1-aminocyclopropane-1-carboxylate deaminase/D-cysteine desulfhydrase-like pyridoxal-dependent ACC family enzyme
MNKMPTPPKVRVSRLHHPSLPDSEIWVLRDDEYQGLWGTKARKYQSMIQHCRASGITHIAATGGINSNNLAAAALLCKEAGLHVRAFAVKDRGDEDAPKSGNRLLTRLALGADDLVLIDRADRGNITAMMESYAGSLAAKGIKAIILEEGAGCLAAVPGAMTLADELIAPRPEWPDERLCDHVFIDSGTALTSAALAAGLARLPDSRRPKLHVIQMAGFDEQLQNAFARWVTPVTSVTYDDVVSFTRVYRPLKPKSYGATSAELFAFIQDMARNHGILTDPVYSAKLFMRAFDLIKGQNLKGRIVIIHTGGMTGLMGYSHLADRSRATEI